jgi:antitoxin HicB
MRYFHLYLRPEPEGGYTAFVPALPGCISYGETVEEAKKMAGEAIEAYLESMRQEGESPVTDEGTLLTAVDVLVHV